MSETYSHLVGIGASAGGMAAIEQLLEGLTPGSGMAYVVVPHLQAGFDSDLDEILRRRCALPVVRIEDGLIPCDDHVYVLTRRHLVAVVDGRLRLREQPPQSLPIDPFFVSLAAALGPQAIGIVLSGSGRDGASGLEAIHRGGGLALAQSPRSSRFDDMPRAALATGVVAADLPPGAMPQLLRRYAVAGKAALRRQQSPPAPPPFVPDPDVPVAPQPFFTPAPLFHRLRDGIIPSLLKRPAPPSLRILCCGNDRGETTYALTILLQEQARTAGLALKLEVFAGGDTPATLRQIAAGVYPCRQLATVDAELLQRYLVPTGDEQCRMHADLRRQVVPLLLEEDSPPTESGFDLIVHRALPKTPLRSREQSLLYLQQALHPHGTLVGIDIEERLHIFTKLPLGDGIG